MACRDGGTLQQELEFAASIAAQLQNFFFKFCRDLFCAFTTTVAATIAAIIAAKIQNFFFIL
jgi:hypothetical protein